METTNAHGPVIDSNTTLAKLQRLGAMTLSDIPLVELLEFVRNQCLTCAKDDGMPPFWTENFAVAANNVQSAIEHVTSAVSGNL